MSSNKEVRTDLTTTATDPLAAARANPSVSDQEAAGRSAFSQYSGESGGYDSLSDGGKQAFRSLGLLDAKDERFAGAKQAALDAVRDAKIAGLFNPQTATPQQIAESKDPAVRNQAPTGTNAESSGPATTVNPTPPGPAPAPAATGEPNTTTPAVKGQKT
jgi:hypothetical protein